MKTAEQKQILAGLFRPVEAGLSSLESLLSAELASDVRLIETVSSHLVAAGGKRFRPALAMLFAGACGLAPEKVTPVAAAVEFIHTATLLHDDVVDEADRRRGRPSANAAYGNAAAVLVGDYLYTRAFQLMVSAGQPGLLPLLADATNDIARGEVMQLSNVRRTDVPYEEYLQVIRAKTAVLFEASCAFGAMMAGATDEQVAAASAYGLSLGIAFQIIDDCLDYAGDEKETGKAPGNDLREGKMTAPLIFYARENPTGAEKLIQRAVVAADESAIAELLDAVRRSGALGAAKKEAEKAVSDAVKAVKVFPESDFKKSLCNLALASVMRKF